MWGFASLGSFEFGVYLGLDISSEYKCVVCLLFYVFCFVLGWVGFFCCFFVDSVFKKSLVIVYCTSLLWGHSEGV